MQHPARSRRAISCAGGLGRRRLAPQCAVERVHPPEAAFECDLLASARALVDHAVSHFKSQLLHELLRRRPEFLAKLPEKFRRLIVRRAARASRVSG